MDELTFDVPGKPRSLNEIGENKWAKRAEIKYWRETTGWALKGHRVPPFAGLVDIEFRVVGPSRLLDHISPTYAIKGLTDGIVDAHILRDDAPKYVNRLILNQPAKAAKPAIEVIVRAAS